MSNVIHYGKGMRVDSDTVDLHEVCLKADFRDHTIYFITMDGVSDHGTRRACMECKVWVTPLPDGLAKRVKPPRD